MENINLLQWDLLISDIFIWCQPKSYTMIVDTSTQPRYISPPSATMAKQCLKTPLYMQLKQMTPNML
jgi:hypothetical protein